MDVEASTLFREYDLIAGRQQPNRMGQPAPHQSQALQKLTDWHLAERAGPTGGILVLPTGGGKTFTAVHFLYRHPISEGFKVLWLAHTHHLLEQALETFDRLVSLVAEPKPSLAIRIVSGATGHFPVHSIRKTDDVVVSSLQTISNAMAQSHHALDEFLAASQGKLFVVFDEAHHSPAPSYRKLLLTFQDRCPECRLLGLTATPTYGSEKKQGWLRILFPQGILHQETPQKLMAAGVLARPVLEEPRTKYEPDFDEREYQKWVDSNRDLPEGIIRHLAENKQRNDFIVEFYDSNREKYGKTIIFADRWFQCEYLRERLIKRGIRADAVYSHVDAAPDDVEGRRRRTSTENAEVLKKFKDGELDVLINVRMLTEGTDVPSVQTVFLTRQTTSQILLTQMVGRALRGPNFGGTDRAYIVSFIDDWKHHINWAGFDQLAPGLADNSVPEYGKRPPLELISIELVRRLARQADSGRNMNPAPYQSFLPVGWYHVEYFARVEGSDDIEPLSQLVMVFDHQQVGFVALIDALKSDSTDLTELEGDGVRLTECRPILENWQRRFFESLDHSFHPRFDADIFSIARHMAQNERNPPKFFAFDRRSDHDLDRVAQSSLAEEWNRKREDDVLHSEYTHPDRFWRVLYPTFDHLKSHYNACVDRLLHARRHDSPPNEHRPQFVSPEVVPFAEPSEDLKEQVKSRDGHRCCCCGSERGLQVDHVVSAYHGGAGDFENLQSLCKECNVAKKTASIRFRNNMTKLTSEPGAFPSLVAPRDERAGDADVWEQFLRRAVNLYYKCGAVDTVEVGERGERLRHWRISLFPGNDPRWLTTQVPLIIAQIRSAREEAGYKPAPDDLLFNEPTLPKVKPADAAIGNGLVTFDRVRERILDVEGFHFEVRHRDSRQVRGDRSGFEPYPFERRMPGEETVDSWIRKRFLPNYGDFEGHDFVVHVLDAQEQPAWGNKKLRNVRDSYGH